MDDEEEACTPRADEATPLNPVTARPRRHLVLGAACATLALGAAAEGYGLEFQGDFDYSFQASYSGFDFCTWNTMEDSFYLHQDLEPPAMPDPSRA